MLSMAASLSTTDGDEGISLMVLSDGVSVAFIRLPVLARRGIKRCKRKTQDFISCNELIFSFLEVALGIDVSSVQEL